MTLRARLENVKYPNQHIARFQSITADDPEVFADELVKAITAPFQEAIDLINARWQEAMMILRTAAVRDGICIWCSLEGDAHKADCPISLALRKGMGYDRS